MLGMTRAQYRGLKTDWANSTSKTRTRIRSRFEAMVLHLEERAVKQRQEAEVHAVMSAQDVEDGPLDAAVETTTTGTTSAPPNSQPDAGE